MKKQKEVVEGNEVVNVDVEDSIAEFDPGANALDILNAHVATTPYDPGFMKIAPNKGAKSFNAGSLGTMDGPLECIILSVNIRRGLWPPDKTVSVGQLAVAFECLPDDLAGYKAVEVKDWCGPRPLCGSSGNGGSKGALNKVVDADAPDVVERFLSPPSMAAFNCAKCKWNEFGSDLRQGRGKACKESHMLLLYFPKEDMAATVSLPPTSIKPWREYKTSLPHQNFASCFTAVGTLSIEADGNTWNIFEFEPAKVDGKIVPVTPESLAELGQQVSYGGREVIKLQALIAEFLNIELEEETDYPNGGGAEKGAPPESDKTGDANQPF